MHLPPCFIILCLLVRKLSCWQTHTQTGWTQYTAPLPGRSKHISSSTFYIWSKAVNVAMNYETCWTNAKLLIDILLHWHPGRATTSTRNTAVVARRQANYRGVCWRRLQPLFMCVAVAKVGQDRPKSKLRRLAHICHPAKYERSRSSRRHTGTGKLESRSRRFDNFSRSSRSYMPYTPNVIVSCMTARWRHCSCVVSEIRGLLMTFLK